MEIKVNGWGLYWLPILKKRIDKLEKTVTARKEKNTDTYLEHKSTLELALYFEILYKLVPAYPDNEHFNISNYIGKKYNLFRRVKKPLPPRYRMFFAFSPELKKIVYVWMNGKKHIRSAGDFNDVYEAFKRKLASKKIPYVFTGLLADSKDFETKLEEILPKEN